MRLWQGDVSSQVDNENVTDLDEDLPPMAERIHLVRKILELPDFRHPKRYTRMGATLALLLRNYELEPGRRTSEKEILAEVFLGRYDHLDTNARKTVDLLRTWLANYFLNREPESAMVVNIPIGRYILEFRRRNLQLEMRPTEWFWSDYLQSDLPSIFGVGEGWSYKGYYYRDKSKPMNLEFTSECLLDTYRMFSRVLPVLPEILKPGWEYRNSLRESGSTVVVGLPCGVCQPLDDFWRRWNGSIKPLIMTIDPHLRVFLSNPDPEEGDPAILLDSDSTVYGLVSRIKHPEQPALTVIQAGNGETIAKIMDLLTTDQALEAVVSSADLGGRTLSTSAPEIFQLLFRVEIEPPPPDSDEWDEPVGLTFGPAKFVRSRLMDAPSK